MPFWKPKKKKKAVHKAKPAKSLPKYEPKPFIPPEIPKIDISANQQKEPQKPAPKKASSSRADDNWFTPMYFSDIWHTRRIISQMMDILQEERESDDH